MYGIERNINTVVAITNFRQKFSFGLAYHLFFASIRLDRLGAIDRICGNILHMHSIHVATKKMYNVAQYKSSQLT